MSDRSSLCRVLGACTVDFAIFAMLVVMAYVHYSRCGDSNPYSARLLWLLILLQSRVVVQQMYIEYFRPIVEVSDGVVAVRDV